MAIARNLVVIGTSAGGVPALQQIVEALPADSNVAVCIVMHIPSHTPTHLDKIFSGRRASHTQLLSEPCL